MQELAIWSQIPPARETQVLSILTGLTGTQPTPICEQTLIYAQTAVPEVKVSKRQKQQQSQYDQQQQQQSRPRYHKLFRTIAVASDGTSKAGGWSFRAEHTPEPGPLQIIKTRFVEQHADAASDIERIKQPGLYRYASQFLVTGQRFIMGNVVVRLYRYLLPEQDLVGDPLIVVPSPQRATLVDTSGTLIVEAVIRVEDAGNAKLNSSAKDELGSFASKMEGTVVFRAVERLSLDTQVK